LLPECVADFTRRPLLSLTVADIGTDEQTMENNLHRWFEMAASWDAIILIDEADVFLEKRTVADLQRNSLVSGEYYGFKRWANGQLIVTVFLRCMEYYTGMLFLVSQSLAQIFNVVSFLPQLISLVPIVFLAAVPWYVAIFFSSH
jgi:hypothetical protein